MRRPGSEEGAFTKGTPDDMIGDVAARCSVHDNSDRRRTRWSSCASVRPCRILHASIVEREGLRMGMEWAARSPRQGVSGRRGQHDWPAVHMKPPARHRWGPLGCVVDRRLVCEGGMQR